MPSNLIDKHHMVIIHSHIYSIRKINLYKGY